MATLHGFRFVQVGNGPVERRAGTLLALLGAEVAALLEPAEAERVLATPSATHHAGRTVVLATPAEAAGLPRSGVIDGSGQVAARPGVVSVAARPTGRQGWAASGAMALTGSATGPPLHAPGDQAAGLWAAAAVLEVLTELGGRRVAVDGPALVAERAAFSGLTRHGPISPAGSCRLVATADGWVAVNLPRRSDLELLEAWLGVVAGDDPWATVGQALQARSAASMVLAGQELGLAVSVVAAPEAAASDGQARARDQSYPMHPFLADGQAPPLAPARRGRLHQLGALAATPRALAGSRVVDFSSLWAGPLATSLLVQAGAEVVKVESSTRPDGARSGDPDFFALLQHGKRSVSIDFTDPSAPAQLRSIVEGAALVVEASRPRAFEQLGLDPAVWRRRHPGGAWVSITAYGRTGPWRQWAGFGDDAAVAGGMVVHAPDGSGPVLCADAYADPVTGLHAAVVSAAALVGSGGTFDLALREVVNHLLVDDGPDEGAPDEQALRVAPPRARPVPGPAPALGEANEELVTAADGVGRGATRQTAKRPALPENARPTEEHA